MIEYWEMVSSAYDGLLVHLLIVFVILFVGRFLAKYLRRITLRLLHRTKIDDSISRRLGQEDSVVLNENISTWVFRLVRLGVIVYAYIYAYQNIPDLKYGTDQVGSFFSYLASLAVTQFLFELLLAYLVTLVLIRVVKYVNTFFEKFYTVIEGWRGTRIKTVKLQKLELLTADRLTDLSVLVARYLRIVVIIVLGFVYLTIVFSFFEGTRDFVSNLLQSIVLSLELAWESVVAYMPKLLNLILIFFGTRYALRGLHFLVKEVEEGNITINGFYTEWAEPTYQLLRIFLVALAFVIAYPSLPGADSKAFEGVSIFLGLLVSLGSTSVIANIVAGIVLIYTRAFNIGDRVKIADTVGDIVERTLLVTRVKTIKNVDITIPNGMVLGSHIINYSSSAERDGLVLHTTVTLGYDVPWRKVHEVLIEAALATDNILSDPKPFILQTSLDDFYVSYEINAFTDQPNRMAATYSNLHQNIQDKCNENDIEILSPHYQANRSGEESTIPKEYWKKS